MDFFNWRLARPKAQERLKVDGVAAVIGEYVVLESDVEKFKKEITIKSEGKVQPKDCEVLEDIMLQKLLAHHAVVDSILVLDAEVEAGVERNIAYFKQQLGSMDKVVDLYGFDDQADLKEELKKIERENLLTSKERQSITEKVTVTPEEIRQYYKNLEASDNLPTFGTEIKLAQITVYAKPSVEAEEKIIKDLNKIRKDIQDGANMKIKALIYSEDPGVAQNGGLYSITRESQFVKEFKEAAFSLELNEVSEPFKSDFGYHILKVEKIKGQQRDVRHILMQPAVSDEKLKETEEL